SARELLHQQLASFGFEHELSPDAPRALAALRRANEAGAPFGLLLLDAELLAGELAAFLDAERAPMRPRVVVLAWAGAPVGPRPEEAAESCLTKPVRPSCLFDALIGALGVDDALRESALATEPTREASFPLRILLAEDNAINQTVAAKILERG